MSSFNDKIHKEAIAEFGEQRVLSGEPLKVYPVKMREVLPVLAVIAVIAVGTVIFLTSGDAHSVVAFLFQK